MLIGARRPGGAHRLRPGHLRRRRRGHPARLVWAPRSTWPRNARDGRPPSPADLWALGATLYAAVEGRSPYARKHRDGHPHALAAGPPAPPHAGRAARAGNRRGCCAASRATASTTTRPAGCWSTAATRPHRGPTPALSARGPRRRRGPRGAHVDGSGSRSRGRGRFGRGQDGDRGFHFRGRGRGQIHALVGGSPGRRAGSTRRRGKPPAGAVRAGRSGADDSAAPARSPAGRDREHPGCGARPVRRRRSQHDAAGRAWSPWHYWWPGRRCRHRPDRHRRPSPPTPPRPSGPPPYAPAGRRGPGRPLRSRPRPAPTTAGRARRAPATVRLCPPGHRGAPVPARAPAPGEGFRPPSGWIWHADTAGFRVSVPATWYYSRDGVVACFQDPATGRAFSVAAGGATDPLVGLRQVRDAAARGRGATGVRRDPARRERRGRGVGVPLAGTGRAHCCTPDNSSSAPTLDVWLDHPPTRTGRRPTPTGRWCERVSDHPADLHRTAMIRATVRRGSRPLSG